MRSREFVAFLASISATTALGIDLILPAFGQVRTAFGLAPDSTSVALTVTTYFLGLSLAQVLYGPLSDRFGRKPVVMTGIALYGAAAVVAGLAPSLPLLLTARLVWGIGAAGPRVLMLAIARDVYEGDRLARVLSMAAALFMVVPALAPLLGQGLLAVVDWRGVFAAPSLLAAALLLWAWRRLDETLAPQDRRPLSLAGTREAVQAVVRTRISLGYALVQMFDFAAFASFLATSELLFDRVYDRSSQFPAFFGAMSLLMGLVAFIGSRTVGRFGARRMILTLFCVNLVTVAALFVVSIAGGGAPPFLAWFGLLTVSNSLRVVINPLAGSESMQPMGRLAGSAASVMGLIGMGGGSLLAGATDRFIGDSVTPLSAAYLGYSIAGFVAVLYANGIGRRSVADPLPQSTDVEPQHAIQGHRADQADHDGAGRRPPPPDGDAE